VVGSANAVRAVGAFASLTIMEDVLVPNMGSAQPGTITYSSGAYGYVKLHPRLLQQYSTVVSDPIGSAINIYAAYIH
jgi:hypothetical protein